MQHKVRIDSRHDVIQHDTETSREFLERLNAKRLGDIEQAKQKKPEQDEDCLLYTSPSPRDS